MTSQTSVADLIATPHFEEVKNSLLSLGLEPENRDVLVHIWCSLTGLAALGATGIDLEVYAKLLNAPVAEVQPEAVESEPDILPERDGDTSGE